MSYILTSTQKQNLAKNKKKQNKIFHSVGLDIVLDGLGQ
jgi:hypothetical protein